MIRFKNVSKIYPRNSIALQDIDLEIQQKEFVSLVGQSGAGKSTLIRLLIREEAPTKGSIFYGDTDIAKISHKEIPFYRRKMGTVFQDFYLLPDKNAYENVAFAMEMSGYPTKQIREDVPRVLKIVGLSDKAEQFPDQLSGGEKQRVAIARSLIHRPDILMADEPTGNLDPINTWDIVKLLLKINELGTTVILATHDKDIVNSLKRRVIHMKGGRIIKDEEVGNYML
ncbi:MAG: cell division ATP-binding protein FtsE [Parcubacteria group bacterium RIFCSPHIGHO2_01_FULL_47_10b]|nr:MAG: cell division ATP-binding protein FtsE [Parcubacteria group bacterium RIFCSPHIGHO2_01_FULL_47_10b]